MTVPVKVFTNTSKRAMLALLALGTPKFYITTASYTPDQDNHIFLSSVTNEASGTNYPSGGITLTNVVVNVDASTNKATLDADDITTAGLSISACRWGIIVVSTGTASTSPLIAYCDLSEGAGGNVPFTGMAWDANGIVPFAAAA